MDRKKLLSAVRASLYAAKHSKKYKPCLDYDVLDQSFKLIKRIGSDSKNGEAFKLCYPVRCEDESCDCNDDPIYLALKNIPLRTSEDEHYANPYSTDALKYSSWVEFCCMRLARTLVTSNVCPNLPMIMHHNVCDCKRRKSKKCLLLVNEFATHGDLKQWSKTPRSTAIWLNAYFQIFAGLYAMQKYFDMTHHDMHWGNVLVYETTPGGFWRYIIDGNTYDVPNLGFVFVLWDFGYARIPGKMEIDKYKNYYQSPTENPRLIVDYERIINAPNWRAHDDDVVIPVPTGVQQFVQTIETLYSKGALLSEVIKVFKKLYSDGKMKNEMILDEYSMDKRIDSLIPNELKQFLRETAPVKEPPTELQMRMTRLFRRYRKNSFVQPATEDADINTLKNQTKRFLNELSQSDAYHAIEELGAANYPPPPVEDIPYPDRPIDFNVALASIALESINRHKRILPSFVMDVKHTIQQRFAGKAISSTITRALWTRFCRWFQLVEPESEIQLQYFESYLHLPSYLTASSNDSDSDASTTSTMS